MAQIVFKLHKRDPKTGSCKYRQEGSTVSWKCIAKMFAGEPPAEITVIADNMQSPDEAEKNRLAEKAKKRDEAIAARAAKKKERDEARAAKKKEREEKRAAAKAERDARKAAKAVEQPSGDQSVPPAPQQ